MEFSDFHTWCHKKTCVEIFDKDPGRCVGFSDFHTWGDSLCRAFSEGRALVTLPEWKYAPPATRAPFGGWFAPPHCPGAFVPSEAQVLTGTEHPDCAPRGHTGAQMRRAATEFLFRQPPPHVRTCP